MKFQKLIAALVARLLPTKTVDKAVTALTKAASMLAAAEAAENKKVADLTKQANNLLSEAEAAAAAAQRASRVGEKLRELVA